MGKLAAAIHIARRIRREQGLLELIHRMAGFVVRHIGGVCRLNVFAHEVPSDPAALHRPPVPAVEVRWIRSEAEADALPYQEDFRDFSFHARSALRDGALAVCFYLNGEFAHVGWIAFDPLGKRWVDNIPFAVDFQQGEAVTGGTWTRPKYRGRGLMAYSYFLRFEYLSRAGYRCARSAVVRGNTPSERVHARFGGIQVARGLLIRVGTWRYWHERPVPHADPMDGEKMRS